MIELRSYQREAIDSLYRWFETQGGDPVIVLPTGSGKSAVQAAFIQEVLSRWEGQRILCLVHVKELVEQNFRTLKQLWPEAPAGIYSAGVGRREANPPIVIAGIQSVYRKARELGHRDLVIIDESHRIPPDGSGMYQTLLTGLRETNPHLRLIGLTATPYRMGQGYLWDGEGALFDGPSYQIDMGELIRMGYLSPLTTSPVVSRADLSGVKTRQGDFVEGDLEKAMDSITDKACREMVDLGADRRKWIIFCAGVSHAKNVTRTLRDLGVPAELVTGDTPNEMRDAIVDRFRAGEIRALVNVMVLTTGFDVPDVDMLVFLRPTLSPGLFVQMAGRGTRIAEGKSDCLLLDFARNLDRHGPVDKIGAPGIGTGEPGEAPTKRCPECGATMYAGATTCPSCGFEMPRDPEKKLTSRASSAQALSDDRPQRREVFGVSFHLHQKMGKPDSMRVEYDCGLQVVRQWICPLHGEYARYKAEKWWSRNIAADMPADVSEMVQVAEDYCRPIAALWTRMNGKFEEVVRTEIGERHAVMSDVSEIPF